MGTSEVSKDGIGEQMDRIKKTFANAGKVADAIFPEPGEQREEGTFESEHFALAKKHVDEALECYTPPFCEKVLQAVIAELEPKKKAYELEVQRQTADDNLLDVTSEWPTERVEALIATLRGQKNE
jgi:hypothetical protein